MFRLLTKQLKRHRYGLTQAVALFFAATILIASIGRTKAAALRPTPPPITVTAGDGGLFSSSGDDWLVNLMLAAVAFAGTTSLLFLCAKRSKGTTPAPKVPNFYVDPKRAPFLGGPDIWGFGSRAIYGSHTAHDNQSGLCCCNACSLDPIAPSKLFMLNFFGAGHGGYCRHDPSGLRELPWFVPPESELAVGPCAVVCAHASGMIRLARELLY